jgi:hypothetical protein
VAKSANASSMSRATVANTASNLRISAAFALAASLAATCCAATKRLSASTSAPRMLSSSPARVAASAFSLSSLARAALSSLA